MDQSADYLTTKELAELLRIKERKVYDMAASGDVPCVRVVGKLLFPRAEVASWIEATRSGPMASPAHIPSVFAGSHDPLLDWALRESGSGLAAFFDGSHDGLERVAAHQALGCSTHIHEPDGWNVETVRKAFGNKPVVLVEFARRQRGLILAPGKTLKIQGIADISGRRFARRQNSAASQRLFEEIAEKAGLDLASLGGPATPSRTEDEVAVAVVEGKADVAFGLASVARQFKLEFVPVIEERFDLLVWRREWFEPPFQTFLKFVRSSAFSDRAAEMGGYDLAGLGTIHFNSAAI